MLQTIRRLPILLSLGQSSVDTNVNVPAEFRRAVKVMTKEKPKNEMRLWMTKGVLSRRVVLGWWRGRVKLWMMSIAKQWEYYYMFPYPKAFQSVPPMHCTRFWPEYDSESSLWSNGLTDGEESELEDSVTDSASEGEEEEEDAIAVKEREEMEKAERIHKHLWQKVMQSLLNLASCNCEPGCKEKDPRHVLLNWRQAKWRRKRHHPKKGTHPGQAYRNIARDISSLMQQENNNKKKKTLRHELC